ncbi:hypothetical protein CDAR_266401 [Caerostris darwini]|uniref:Uncharacterized protein n=1 Tax=Caerostris darwini TaxID=1538125 RepID=A0AAV4Q2P0_9ARAC|nr:hypothetical protein CDAR_266401 [Caerostris darwini]
MHLRVKVNNILQLRSVHSRKISPPYVTSSVCHTITLKTVSVVTLDAVPLPQLTTAEQWVCDVTRSRPLMVLPISCQVVEHPAWADFSLLFWRAEYRQYHRTFKRLPGNQQIGHCGSPGDGSAALLRIVCAYFMDNRPRNDTLLTIVLRSVSRLVTPCSKNQLALCGTEWPVFVWRDWPGPSVATRLGSAAVLPLSLEQLLSLQYGSDLIVAVIAFCPRGGWYIVSPGWARGACASRQWGRWREGGP